jgi:hypothetical protein
LVVAVSDVNAVRGANGVQYRHRLAAAETALAESPVGRHLLASLRADDERDE